jgi:hypothetical protein
MPTDEVKDEDQAQSADSATPGNAHGVPVPHEDAAESTSEEYPAVDGVYTFPETAQEQETDDLPAAGDHKDMSK